MWRNQNAYILLTGLHNGIAAMEYEVSKKKKIQPPSVPLSPVAQSCSTLCNLMNRSTPRLPIHPVHQLCPTPCDPMDYRPPGSYVHGILQAIILEWVAISFSTQESNPGLLHCRWILNRLSHQGCPQLTHA